MISKEMQMSQQDNAMNAEPAVITMTLHITRAATGKTETIDVVCTPQRDSQSATIEQQKEQ